MANANTFIVDWDAKFHYNYWRPVTAIRNGDNDGNDATERDAGWTPLNTTPMHPEYPSQAAILAGAGTAALAAALGGAPSTPVNIVDSADPKLTRNFASIAALAEEQRLVRIWGGIHFRTSLEVSDRMGQAIVKHLAETTYRPVRRCDFSSQDPTYGPSATVGLRGLCTETIPYWIPVDRCRQDARGGILMIYFAKCK